MPRRQPRSDADDAALVRPSRDGDQFHYHWAARRCLELLKPGTSLESIQIEGLLEEDRVAYTAAGEAVIDLAEYYRADVNGIQSVTYSQLKHSTTRPNDDWTLSGLTKTFDGFARRFAALVKQGAGDGVSFLFVSNRPVSPKLLDAVAHLAGRSNSSDVVGLREAIKLDEAEVAPFCNRLQFMHAPGLVELMQEVDQAVAGYLPGPSDIAMTKLVSMVSLRASSVDTSPIKLTDVLLKLGTTYDQMFPAPSTLTVPEPLLAREAHRTIADQIFEHNGSVLVHAIGGVGKSTFAASLETLLPAATVIIYDCFADGAYRQPSRPRHTTKAAFAQIANELAARGLGRPLIPLDASREDYARAFVVRLAEAAAQVHVQNSQGRLILVVDAADNAVMRAEELKQGPSFVADLIDETLPADWTVVLLCRTERVAMVDPRGVLERLELNPFDENESAAHLRLAFSNASEQEGIEFHRATGGNPRVQSNALESFATVSACLAGLAPMTGPPDAALNALFDRQWRRSRDQSHSSAQHDAVARCLATLPPRIPLETVSKVTGADTSFVRSFAADFGPSLRLGADSLQFRDEPTETWFRQQFRLTGNALEPLLTQLTRLAVDSTYAATALPQLLWEGRSEHELLDLALTEDGLPAEGTPERQDVDQYRTEFALKAALRTQRFGIAARLAIRAGRLASGRERLHKVVRDRSDLAGQFLSSDTIGRLIADRALASDTPGSNLAPEGVLLASASDADADADAQSTLRAAWNWILALTRLPDDDQARRSINADELALIAYGMARVRGVNGALAIVRGWRSPKFKFAIARALAERLATRGDWDVFNDVLASEAADKYVQLAFTSVALVDDVPIGLPGATRIAQTLVHHRNRLDLESGFGRTQDAALAAIVGAISICRSRGLVRDKRASDVLSQYLPAAPPHGLGQYDWRRTVLHLQAWSLDARLRGVRADPDALLPTEIRRELAGETHVSTPAGRAFEGEVRPALPWFEAWADTVCQGPTALQTVGDLDQQSPVATEASTGSTLSAAAGCAIVVISPASMETLAHRLLAPVAWSPIAEAAVRIFGEKDEQEDTIYDLLAALANRAEQSGPDVDTRIDAFLSLASTALRFDQSQSKVYFDRAVTLANEVGDEAFEWQSTCLAFASAVGPARQAARLAYSVARTSEAVRPYIYDNFDTSSALVTLAILHPPSAIAVGSRWADRRVDDPTCIAAGLLDERKPAVAGLEAVALQQMTDRVSVEQVLATVTPEDSARAEAWLDQQVGTFTVKVPRPEAGTPSSDEPRQSRDWAGADEPVDPAQFGAMLREEGLDFTRSADLQSIYARDLSWREVSALPAAIFSGRRRDWAGILRAYAAAETVPLHSFDSVFQHLANVNDLPAGVRDAAGELANAVAARFPTTIVQNGYNPSRSSNPDTVADATRGTFMRAALVSYGDHDARLPGRAYFGLARNIAPNLTVTEALQALQDVLNTAAYLHHEDTGDGPWADALDPGDSVSVSLAGYLLAALADPDDRIRWRAAHALRTAAALRLNELLKSIPDLALSELSPYRDAGLPRYKLHEQLWLLLALDRARIDDPTSTEILIPFLMAMRAQAGPHALIDPLLDRIIGDAERSSSSRQPLIPLDRFKRPHAHDEESYGGEGPRLPFDFAKYWLRPLAAIFGLHVDEVARRVLATILEWDPSFDGNWQSDARIERQVLDRESGQVWHGEWPTSHDERFYLAFHAMLAVAADLHNSSPRYVEPTDPEDEYDRWLRRYQVARSDLRWLSDRRDPAPAGQAVWPDDSDSAGDLTWRWNVQLGDLTRELQTDDGRIVIFSERRRRSERRGEDIRVIGALVTPDRAEALQRWLQNSSSDSTYRIPHYPDELSSVDGTYNLLGWIDLDRNEGGLDRHDERAGKVGWPPPRPARAVTDALGLVPDADFRHWRDPNGIQMEIMTWSDVTDGRGRRLGVEGEHIVIDRAKLDAYLADVHMDLLAAVTVDRSVYDYGGRRTDRPDMDFDGHDDYFGIFRYRAGLGWSDGREPR